MAVIMTTIPALPNGEESCVIPALQGAVENLDRTDGKAVLDFSSVYRIDSHALRAMEDFVRIADDKGVKVVLCGVSVGVYKVLKLAKLASRFSIAR
jgi:anti-anti-sigma regulatory factor